MNISYCCFAQQCRIDPSICRLITSHQIWPFFCSEYSCTRTDIAQSRVHLTCRKTSSTLVASLSGFLLIGMNKRFQSKTSSLFQSLIQSVLERLCEQTEPRPWTTWRGPAFGPILFGNAKRKHDERKERLGVGGEGGGLYKMNLMISGDGNEIGCTV